MIPNYEKLSCKYYNFQNAFNFLLHYIMWDVRIHQRIIKSVLYKETFAKNMLYNYGKKQYQTSKEDDDYLKELYKA